MCIRVIRERELSNRVHVRSLGAVEDPVESPERDDSATFHGAETRELKVLYSTVVSYLRFSPGEETPDSN